MKVVSSKELLGINDNNVNNSITSKEDALLYTLKYMYDSEEDDNYYKYLLSILLNEIKDKNYFVEGDIFLSDVYYYELIKDKPEIAHYVICDNDCNSIDFELNYYDKYKMEEKNMSFISIPSDDSDEFGDSSMQLNVSSDNKLFYINYDMSYVNPKVEVFSYELGDDKYRSDAVVDYYHDIFLIDSNGERREYKAGKSKLVSSFAEVFNLKTDELDMGFDNTAIMMLLNNFYDYKNLLNDIKLGVFNRDYSHEYRIIDNTNNIDKFLNEQLEINEIKKNLSFLEEIKLNRKLNQIKKIIESCADNDGSIAIDNNLLVSFSDYICSNDNNFYGIGKVITKNGDEYVAHNIAFDGQNRKDFVATFSNIDALDGFNFVDYDSDFNTIDYQVNHFFQKNNAVYKKKSK